MINKKYEAIDGLKALSCAGIVAMHVLSNGKYNLDGYFFQKVIPSFTNLVFLFMTLSAFGMCCGYYEKMINGTLDIVSFYKKRYKKILPFFALLCIIDLVFSPSLESLYEVIANLTLCFGLIPNANITVIGVGWFLGVVFAFYLLFPFFCFLLSDKKRAWLSFVISLIMNYICKNYFGAERTSIVYCFVYFMAGGMLYIYRDKAFLIHHSFFVLFLMVVAIVCYFIFDGNTISILFICVLSLVYSIDAPHISILRSRPLKFMANISFEVYLCHMVVYRLVEKLHLLHLAKNELVNYVFSYFAVLLGAMAFAIVFKKTNEMTFTAIDKKHKFFS